MAQVEGSGTAGANVATIAPLELRARLANPEAITEAARRKLKHETIILSCVINSVYNLGRAGTGIVEAYAC